MAVNDDNVIIGPIKIEYSLNGSDYTDVGITNGGFEIRKEEEIVETLSDQGIGVLDKNRSLVRQFLKFTVNEVLTTTLVKLAFGMDSSPDTAMDYISAVPKRYFRVTGKSVTGTMKIYTSLECWVGGNTPTLNLARDEAAAIEIEAEEKPTIDDSTGKTTFGKWSSS